MGYIDKSINPDFDDSKKAPFICNCGMELDLVVLPTPDKDPKYYIASSCRRCGLKYRETEFYWNKKLAKADMPYCIPYQSRT